MKQVENKKVSVTSPSGKPFDVSYFDWLRDAVNNPPQGGFGPDEMRGRMVLVTKIKVAEDEKKSLELEVAELTKMKALVNAMTWNILDKEILDFIDYVNAL